MISSVLASGINNADSYLKASMKDARDFTIDYTIQNYFWFYPISIVNTEIRKEFAEYSSISLSICS